MTKKITDPSQLIHAFVNNLRVYKYDTFTNKITIGLFGKIVTENDISLSENLLTRLKGINQQRYSDPVKIYLMYKAFKKIIQLGAKTSSEASQIINIRAFLINALDIQNAWDKYISLKLEANLAEGGIAFSSHPNTSRNVLHSPIDKSLRALKALAKKEIEQIAQNNQMTITHKDYPNTTEQTKPLLNKR